MHLSKPNSKQTVKLARVILDVNHLLTYSTLSIAAFIPSHQYKWHIIACPW